MNRVRLSGFLKGNRAATGHDVRPADLLRNCRQRDPEAEED